MKILIVCERFDIGGAETRILTLCKGLKRKGHMVVVASSGGALVDDLTGLGVTHCFIDFAARHHISKHITELQSIIESYDIEIAHIHPYASLIPGILTAWQAGIPYTITVHSPFGLNQANWLRLLQEVFSNQFIAAAMNLPASMLIAASPEIKQRLLQGIHSLTADSVTVIPNAVDSELFRPSELTGPPRNFLIVSRLDPDKLSSILAGFQIFRSYYRLTGSGALAIAGSGQSEEILRQEAKKLGRDLNTGILFLGRQSRIHEIIPAYDVVIGMGRVVIEAGMCGKIPILAGYDGPKCVLVQDNVPLCAETNFSGRGLPSLLPDKIATTVASYPLEKLQDLRSELCSRFSAQIWTEREEVILKQLLNSGDILHPRGLLASLTRRLIELLYTTTQLLTNK